MVSAILSGCLALITAVTAAQVDGLQAASPAAAPRSAPELVAGAKDPFARLFPAPQIAPPSRLPQTAPSIGRLEPNTADFEIICGMRIWRVDERQDPRMLLPRLQTNVDAKIRKIAPTVCRNAAPADPSNK